jgi:hypothetical protein
MTLRSDSKYPVHRTCVVKLSSDANPYVRNDPPTAAGADTGEEDGWLAKR